MRRISLHLGLILLLIAACGGGEAHTDLTLTAPLAGAPNAAVHGTLTHPTDDRLVAATSPACGAMELHESETDAEGRHVMRPVEAIELPAGHEVSLDAGGLHVMCLDVDQTLEPGDTVTLTLTLDSGGSIATTAEVVAHPGHDH